MKNGIDEKKSKWNSEYTVILFLVGFTISLLLSRIANL